MSEVTRGAEMRLKSSAGLRNVVSLMSLVCLGTHSPAVGADSPNPRTFAQALDGVQAEAYGKIVEYVRQNPRAEDIHEAYAWLFASAREWGLEVQAVAVAEQYFRRGDGLPQTLRQAGAVRILGLARSGDLKTAQVLFEQELAGVSLRTPEPAVELGMGVIAEAQLQSDLAVVRRVLDRLSSTFFLNPTVRRQCGNRLRKLELMQQEAPAIGLTCLDGKAVEVSQYAGKVLLVDFWATNCPPCLEEFPNLKRVYRDYHPRGFEVIGISLDSNRRTVADFQAKWKLPWKLALHGESRQGPKLRYRVETIPSMFLVDRSGKVVAFDLKGNALRRAVSGLIDGKPEASSRRPPGPSQ